MTHTHNCSSKVRTSHTHTHACTHACTHAHTHTCTNTQTHTQHTHTYTHPIKMHPKNATLRNKKTKKQMPTKTNHEWVNKQIKSTMSLITASQPPLCTKKIQMNNVAPNEQCCTKWTMLHQDPNEQCCTKWTMLHQMNNVAPRSKWTKFSKFKQTKQMIQHNSSQKKQRNKQKNNWCTQLLS